jgi:hypothetical protein
VKRFYEFVNRYYLNLIPITFAIEIFDESDVPAVAQFNLLVYVVFDAENEKYRFLVLYDEFVEK